MDENQIATENQKDNKCECKSGSVWKCLLAGLLIFLGAFCAAYVILDWHFKSMLTSTIPLYADKQMENFIKHDVNAMNKFAKNNNKILEEKSSNIIHMKLSKNAYKIYIDLKAFDNNENNLNIINDDNTLTINGKTVKKSKNQEHILRFQQSYMFGDNVKLEELTKEIDGEYLVITIPIDTKAISD